MDTIPLNLMAYVIDVCVCDLIDTWPHINSLRNFYLVNVYFSIDQKTNQLSIILLDS